MPLAALKLVPTQALARPLLLTLKAQLLLLEALLLPPAAVPPRLLSRLAPALAQDLTVLAALLPAVAFLAFLASVAWEVAVQLPHPEAWDSEAAVQPTAAAADLPVWVASLVAEHLQVAMRVLAGMLVLAVIRVRQADLVVFLVATAVSERRVQPNHAI